MHMKFTLRPRHPHFLRHWREDRGIALADMATLLGVPEATLAAIEAGVKAYDQRHLEGYGFVLGVAPGLLIAVPPSGPAWEGWDDLNSDAQALTRRWLAEATQLRNRPQ